MVTADEFRSYQLLSARKPPDLHHMVLQQASVASPVQHAPNLRGFSTCQQNAVAQSPKLKPTRQDISYPTGESFLNNPQCASVHMLGRRDKPTDAPCGTQKKFVIFDQSGKDTRLFISPSFAPQLIASNTLHSADHLRFKVRGKLDQQMLLKPIVEETWEGSDLANEDSEMREDTEEIDALLYSSSDEYIHDYDSDGDSDEVTSAEHIPLNIAEGHDMESLLEKLAGEEVASSVDPPKRQKLLDGKYKKPSSVSSDRDVNPISSCCYDDDSESSCVCLSESDSCKREKKVKIRTALKIIRNIVPELQSDDPISVIDEAIAYLKSMRSEAISLGLSRPECDSATTS